MPEVAVLLAALIPSLLHLLSLLSEGETANETRFLIIHSRPIYLLLIKNIFVILTQLIITQF